MYDLVTPLLDVVAGGPCAIHHGYWDDGGESSWTDAVDRLTDLVAQRTPLGRGTRLLDVGCGTGQPVLRIAGDHAVRVTGITVSRVQVAAAAKNAATGGLTHRADFALVDAMSVPYQDGAFDAAWAVQSLLEMTDPDRALREVFRVLDQDGVLVLTDVIDRSTGACATGGMWPTGLRRCSAGQLLTSVEAAGFEILSSEDVSPHTRYFMPRFAEALGEHRQEIARTYGQDVAAWAGAVADYENYVDDMGYVIVQARKSVR